MKYLLLIYGNQEKWASIPAGEWPEAIARQDAFNGKYQATGELIGDGPSGSFGRRIFEYLVANADRSHGQDVCPEAAAVDEIFDDAGAGELLQVQAQLAELHTEALDIRRSGNACRPGD